MLQNSKASSGTDIDTLLEIGLPPGEASQPSHVTQPSNEKSAPNIAMTLPPRAATATGASAQQNADMEEVSSQDARPDPLRPRLRRPEKDSMKRRNRRRSTVVHTSEGSAKVSDKYEPTLGSRPCLHAVWSVRRLTGKSDSLKVAAYYSDEGKEDEWEGLKQPTSALLPIVRSSSVDWIGAADCNINQAVFQTDIFKGRRSLFRFDSMRPMLEERVYDSKNALLKIIANTFTPKISLVGADMQGAF